MNITSSRLQPSKSHYAPKSGRTHQSQEPDADSFTFSGSSGLNRLGKGIGGGIAGAAFSGLLLSLPLSLAPALGADVQSALNVYKAAVLTAGVAGGLASAAMPPGENWY